MSFAFSYFLFERNPDSYKLSLDYLFSHQQGRPYLEKVSISVVSMAII